MEGSGKTYWYTKNSVWIWSSIIITSIIASLTVLWIPKQNNVCKNLSDYITINNNENCWYDPDVDSTVDQISRRYGYDIEQHFVTSEDGYVLHVYRIMSKMKNGTGQPLLIQAGMGGAPELWMMQGAASIIFKLSNAGYDVWLSTVRGSTFIEKEERFSKSDPKYWDYSFHEIGIYDLPALTDYILHVTSKKNKIIFIGHSMSTAASYIYSSEKKEHAEKNLKAIVSLAPTAYMRTVKGFFQFIGPKNVWIWPLTKLVRWHAFGQYQITHKLVYLMCRQYPGVYGCYHFYGFTSGLAPEEQQADLVPKFFYHMPSIISMKTLAHFGQIIQHGRFQKFDYTDDKINMKIYNSTTPPEYDVDRISIPVHIFVGKYDYNSPEADVELLYQKLKKNGVPTTKQVFEFGHTDFFTGKNLSKFHGALLNLVNNLSNLHNVD